MSTTKELIEVENAVKVNNAKTKELTENSNLLNTKVKDCLNNINLVVGALNEEIESKNKLLDKVNEKIEYWDSINRELLKFCQDSDINYLNCIETEEDFKDSTYYNKDAHKNMSIPTGTFLAQDMDNIEAYCSGVKFDISTNDTEDIMIGDEPVNIKGVAEKTLEEETKDDSPINEAIKETTEDTIEEPVEEANEELTEESVEEITEEPTQPTQPTTPHISFGMTPASPSAPSDDEAPTPASPSAP